MNPKYIIGACVFYALTNIGLSYQMRSLPQEISDALKGYQPRDTVKVTEEKTAWVQQIGKWLYLDAMVAHTSFRIRDHYSYDTRFPSEIWNGYLTAVKGSNGEDFYVWSAEPYATKEEDVRKKVDGWFIAQGHSFWGYEPDLRKKAPQLIVPVTTKQWCNASELIQ